MLGPEDACIVSRFVNGGVKTPHSWIPHDARLLDGLDGPITTISQAPTLPSVVRNNVVSK